MGKFLNFVLLIIVILGIIYFVSPTTFNQGVNYIKNITSNMNITLPNLNNTNLTLPSLNDTNLTLPTLPINNSIPDDYCGSILGIKCKEGYICVLDDKNIADSSGKCMLIKQNQPQYG